MSSKGYQEHLKHHQMTDRNPDGSSYWGSFFDQESLKHMNRKHPAYYAYGWHKNVHATSASFIDSDHDHEWGRE